MGICSSRKFFLRKHANVCQDDKRKCLCDSGSIKRTCQQCSFFLNVDHGRFLWIPHRSYFSRQAKKDNFGISAFLAVHLMLAMLSPNWLWLSLNPAKSEGPIPSAIRRTLPGFFTRTSSFTCNSFKNIMMNSGGDGDDETWMVVAICCTENFTKKSINKNIQSIIHEATTNIFNVAFYLALRLYLP